MEPNGWFLQLHLKWFMTGSSSVVDNYAGHHHGCIIALEPWTKICQVTYHRVCAPEAAMLSKSADAGDVSLRVLKRGQRWVVFIGAGMTVNHGITLSEVSFY